MPKVKIRVTLRNDNQNLVQETTGTYNSNILKYTEDNGMKVSFDYKNNVIYRANDEFGMKIDFNSAYIRTNLYGYVHELFIKVIKINKDKKNVQIEYEIDNQGETERYLYRIEEIK